MRRESITSIAQAGLPGERGINVQRGSRGNPHHARTASETFMPRKHLAGTTRETQDFSIPSHHRSQPILSLRRSPRENRARRSGAWDRCSASQAKRAGQSPRAARVAVHASGGGRAAQRSKKRASSTQAHSRAEARHRLRGPLGRLQTAPSGPGRLEAPLLDETQDALAGDDEVLGGFPKCQQYLHSYEGD